jgi:nitrate reductase NapE component
MTAANTERLKEVAGQLRLKAGITVAYTGLLGGSLAVSMWKKRDEFYPFQLIVLGFFAVLFARTIFRYLAGLSWSMVPEEAKRKKAKARQLMTYILCTMLVWFCTAVCLVAAKVFGKLYIVSAVLMGMLMIWMTLATDREIRRLACCFFNPRNEAVSDVIAQTPSQSVYR